MRDLAVTLVVFGSLPFILWRPYIGVLMWTWLAFMNPHRLTWGFAYDMPFAMIVGAVTLAALIITQEEKKIPWTRETVVLLLFSGWMVLTTVFAVYQRDAWEQFDKVAKILLMVFVTMMLMKSKERINLLVWVMTLSLAFFGVKGGLFTLLSGGAHLVWGPGGFIGGNNEIGLALLMTIPLLGYLRLTAERAWMRHALACAMILSAAAVFGTHSRGALVGMVAMVTFLWLKSQKKFLTGIVLAVLAAVLVVFMPEHWFERMGTIKTYQEDASAMGRINAWAMAINLAVDRPLGGGFETFGAEMFAAYAPDPGLVLDAHSIYFEVLGEHGFVGLALFLVLALMTWRSASSIIRRCRNDPSTRWAAHLAAMSQVSLVAYASAGAFLGLAYFNVYYTLIAVVILCKTVTASRETPAPLRRLLAEPRQAGRPVSLKQVA